MGRSFQYLDKGLERIETKMSERYTHVQYVVRKGPNGRRLCKWCGSEVPPRRLVYCSRDCDHNWNMMTSSSYARQCVFERDHGICATCGLDTKTCPNWRQSKWLSEWDIDWRDAKRDWLKEHGYDKWHSTSLWEADHIIAVVDGGHDLGLNNYQTLCSPCHKKKTAELAARRAIDRKQAKESMKAVKVICYLDLDRESA